MTASGRTSHVDDTSPGIADPHVRPLASSSKGNPTMTRSPLHRRFSYRLAMIPPVVALVFGVAALLGAIIFLMTHTNGEPTAAAATQPTAGETRHADPVIVEATADPYEAYLATNPDPQLVLSREDAQARAYLGCGKRWAPGTIDRALADAYRPTGLCDH